MTRAEIIGAKCGHCGHVKALHWHPRECDGCGASFENGEAQVGIMWSDGERHLLEICGGHAAPSAGNAEPSDVRSQCAEHPV